MTNSKKTFQGVMKIVAVLHSRNTATQPTRVNATPVILNTVSLDARILSGRGVSRCAILY